MKIPQLPPSFSDLIDILRTIKVDKPFVRVFLYGTALEFTIFSAISMWMGDLILALVLAGVSALAIMFHRAYTQLE